QRADVQPRLEERVLDGVGGLLAVAKDQPRGRIEAIGVGRGELGERIEIARLCPDHQRLQHSSALGQSSHSAAVTQSGTCAAWFVPCSRNDPPAVAQRSKDKPFVTCALLRAALVVRSPPAEADVHDWRRAMRILVGYASRRGATKGIAERIAVTLDATGLDVLFKPMYEIPRAEDFDAFVLGSSAYMGHWEPDAATFIREQAAILAERPVWLFSSGPIGTDAVDK